MFSTFICSFFILSSTSQHARPYSCCWLKIGALKLFIGLCFSNFKNLLLGGDNELDFLQSLNDIGSSSIDNSKSHMRTFQFQMEP
jgi:hypothetical protein